MNLCKTHNQEYDARAGGFCPYCGTPDPPSGTQSLDWVPYWRWGGQRCGVCGAWCYGLAHICAAYPHSYVVGTASTRTGTGTGTGKDRQA